MKLKIRIRKWLLFSELIGFIFSVFAEEINIKGRVVDEKGNPIGGAEVVLLKNKISSLTADNGIFCLQGNFTSVEDISKFMSSSVKPSIKNKYIDFGTEISGSISVFSIKGLILNKIVFTNRKVVLMEEILKEKLSDGAFVVNINTSGKNISFFALKYNNEISFRPFKIKGRSVSLKTGEVVIDTLRIRKEWKQYVSIPISKLKDSLLDIVLYDVYIPSTKNFKGTPSILGDVMFSESSRTFKDSVTVKMSTKIQNSVIRYTTDGKLPTKESKLYSNSEEIIIKKTTELRARAFVNDSPAGEPSTAIYILRKFDFTSDLPIVILEGYGKSKPKRKDTLYEVGIMVFEPKNGIADIKNIPDLTVRGGYHIRGQSSQSFLKTPYKVELWDNYDNDADYEFLGMPPDADWAFVGPFTDKTFIRNVFIFSLGKEMGLATMDYRYAEVIVSEAKTGSSGGSGGGGFFGGGGIVRRDTIKDTVDKEGNFIDSTDYYGIYTIIQTVKNKKGRLDLKQLRLEDSSIDKISGGYIFKFDQMAVETGKTELECTGAKKMSGIGMGGRVDSTATCWDDLELVDPSPANQQQIKWITNYLQEFHNALHSNPPGDWAKYINMKSFVDLFIINEISRNVDAWIRSQYMYKDRGGVVTCGPIWDYNFSLKNFSNDLEGWHVEENRQGSNDWHIRLWKQPEFKKAVVKRWMELKPTLLSDKAIDARIDEVRAPLKNAAERDLKRWPISVSNIFSGFFDWGYQPEKWEEQIDTLKSWTKARIAKLDSAMATLK